MKTVSKKASLGRFWRVLLVAVAASSVALAALFSAAAGSAHASAQYAVAPCGGSCSASVMTVGSTITVSPSAGFLDGFQATGQTVYFQVSVRDLSSNSNPWQFFNGRQWVTGSGQWRGPYRIAAQSCYPCYVNDVVYGAGQSYLPDFKFYGLAGHHYQVKVWFAYQMKDGGFAQGYADPTYTQVVTCTGGLELYCAANPTRPVSYAGL